MFIPTGDPFKDFDQYDEKQQRWLDRRPRCSECDKHIQDDFAYYINDEWICEECMQEYLKVVEDL